MNPPLDRELTKRQIDVLTLIAQGLGSKQIADRLGIGPRSVETHREGLRRRLGLSSIALFTHYATARGLVTNPFTTNTEDPNAQTPSPRPPQ